MSHRRRGGPAGHAKKSQSSSDILVEETVIDFTKGFDSSETLVDQTDSVDFVFHTSFILDNNTEALQVSYLTTTLKLVKHWREEVKAEKLTMNKK